MSELQEIFAELTKGDISFLRISGGVDFPCDFCGKKVESCLFEVQGEYGKCSLGICGDCITSFIPDPLRQFFQDYWMAEKQEQLKFSMAAKTGTCTQEQESDFFEDISMKYPEFFKMLEQFTKGRYTLGDGSQNKTLQDLADKLLSLRSLNEKQMFLFMGICKDYDRRLSKGETLKFHEEYRVKGEQVDNAITLLKQGYSQFSPDIRERVKSVIDYYGKRGYITDRQFGMLITFLGKMNA